MLVQDGQGQGEDACGDLSWQGDRVGDSGDLSWREVFRLLEELLSEQFD